MAMSSLYFGGALDGVVVLATASTITGVLAHLLYFIWGHRSKQAPGIILFHIISGIGLFAGFRSLKGATLGGRLATAACSGYLVGLFGSIVIYRLWFHKLSSFPGPVAAKITNLYSPWLARDLKPHFRHREFLDKYGEIVRIGPNMLLLRTVDTVRQVYGGMSRCSKADTNYEFVRHNGERDLDSIVDRVAHRPRRRIFDKAFNAIEVDTLEPVIRGVIADWLQEIASKKTVNTSLYSDLIPFDISGKAMFSQEFGSIKAGVEVPLIRSIDNVFILVARTMIDWPLSFMEWIKPFVADLKFFELKIRDIVEKRRQEDSEDKRDFMKYMLQDANSPEPAAYFNKNMMYADATIAMIGGTGTGSTILSFSFYELAKDPALQESLRAAIAPCYGKTVPGEFVFKDIDKIGWLDGFVNEILRLYPPMSTGLWRTTPPEGITLDGTFIPGNTQLMPCMYAIHRYSKFFEQPDELIVERWTTRPELIHTKDSFYPFLIGTLRCPGKRMALEMIKLTLAYTVWNYTFKFAPDADIKALHDKTVFQIVLKAGPLFCEFSKRAEADSFSKA